MVSAETQYLIYLTVWEWAPFIAVVGIGAFILNRALVHFIPGYSRRNRH